MNSLHFKTGLRCLYVFLSHSLIILDYLLKDLAFLEQSAKEAILLDGFRYGNRGREGLKQTIALMSQLTRQKISINSFKEEFESVETESLRDYFSKNEVANNVFNFARQFEDLAFVKTLTNPNSLEVNLKSILMLMLDYSNVQRKNFLDFFDNKTLD